jgi:hypothetical protein
MGDKVATVPGDKSPSSEVVNHDPMDCDAEPILECKEDSYDGDEEEEGVLQYPEEPPLRNVCNDNRQQPTLNSERNLDKDSLQYPNNPEPMTKDKDEEMTESLPFLLTSQNQRQNKSPATPSSPRPIPIQQTRLMSWWMRRRRRRMKRKRPLLFLNHFKDWLTCILIWYLTMMDQSVAVIVCMFYIPLLSSPFQSLCIASTKKPIVVWQVAAGHISLIHRRMIEHCTLLHHAECEVLIRIGLNRLKDMDRRLKEGGASPIRHLANSTALA